MILLIHDYIGPGIQGKHFIRAEERAVITCAGNIEIVKKFKPLDRHVFRLRIVCIGLPFDGRTSESVSAVYEPYFLKIALDLFP